MQTQIACPNCHTPFMAEVHQVIDAAKHPELKQRLLTGQLNVAICPSCGAGGQLATALLFHDPEHEMFIVHVPQEMNIDQMEREKLIGRLAQQAMNDLPPDERRAYMLQPQMMLSMQSFMEKVLETEGVTPEMIARQRKQVELLQTLATADKDVVDHLIKERKSEIDETFFAMLQAYIDAVAKTDDNKQLLALTNLRAKLMVETAVGRRLEKQQIALHGLSRDAKKNEGLTPQILLQHVLANRGDPEIVDALVAAGGGALTYTFFSLLTAEIEKKESAGDQAAAQQLTALRERLLVVFDSLQAESQRIISEAEDLLQTLLSTPDKAAAVQANIARIDDAFMYLLMNRISAAEQSGDADMAKSLNEIYSLVLKQVESQFPPEVLLLNKLIAAENSADQGRILDENQHLISEGLLKMLDAVSEEVQESEQPSIDGRIQGIKAMIAERL